MQDERPRATALAHELERLAGDGFRVVEQSRTSIMLERRNSRLTHVLGALIGGLLGNGMNPSPRTERLWIEVADDGSFRTRLTPPDTGETASRGR